jgi:uncharacterized protein
MAQPVVHFEIGARDTQKAFAFYAELFDWKIDGQSMKDYGLVEAGPGGIGGGIFRASDQFPSHLTIYVQVDDLQMYCDKVVSLGGKVVVPPSPIPGVGAFAMFHDPEGNMIGLFRRG